MAVPAYLYPAFGDMWRRFEQLPDDSIVILNPASGPGRSIDVNYTAALEPMRGRRIEVYGYVDTDYGRRTIASLMADAASYTDWYQPSGIFLDQTPATADSLPYLTEVATRLRDDGLHVAFNPGQPDIDRRLVGLADIIVNFEGNLVQYRSARFPEWVLQEPAAKFWHLVYGVGDADTMTSVMRLAASNGAGATFVTDGVLPNPWDRLPTYWEQELELVRRR